MNPMIQKHTWLGCLDTPNTNYWRPVQSIFPAFTLCELDDEWMYGFKNKTKQGLGSLVFLQSIIFQLLCEF